MTREQWIAVSAQYSCTTFVQRLYNCGGIDIPNTIIHSPDKVLKVFMQ